MTDAQLAEAERLMEGRNRWPGVRTTLVALRDYTDVILQDLVEWCAHPIMGPDYLAATDRFPFLAVKDRQHADWLRFCTASSAKAAALRNADGGGAAPQVPQTPPRLPSAPQLSSGEQLTPVQQLPPVEQLPPRQQSTETPGPAACINLIKEVPGALAAPPEAGLLLLCTRATASP